MKVIKMQLWMGKKGQELSTKKCSYFWQTFGKTESLKCTKKNGAKIKKRLRGTNQSKKNRDQNFWKLTEEKESY